MEHAWNMEELYIALFQNCAAAAAACLLHVQQASLNHSLISVAMMSVCVIFTGLSVSVLPHTQVPSRDVLWRFGNTSAASTFYILSHIEHNSNMRKGDRVFQLGFGGGFKANSAAWTARKTIKQTHSCWLDEDLPLQE